MAEDINFPCKMHMQLMPLDNSFVSRGASTGFLQSQFVPYSMYLSGKKGCWKQKPPLNYSCFQPQQAASKALSALERSDSRAQSAALLQQQILL